MKFLLPVLMLIGAVMASPPTNSCRLEWDFNPETNVVNYRVFSGTSPRNYSSTNDVGNTNLFRFTSLPCGTNYFAVTAVDDLGLESDLSEEVFTNFPCVKPFPVKNLKLQPVP